MGGANTSRSLKCSSVSRQRTACSVACSVVASVREMCFQWLSHFVFQRTGDVACCTVRTFKHLLRFVKH